MNAPFLLPNPQPSYGAHWRSRFIEACKAFEEERVGIWLDLEWGEHVPELEALREKKADEQLARKAGIR